MPCCLGRTAVSAEPTHRLAAPLHSFGYSSFIPLLVENVPRMLMLWSKKTLGCKCHSIIQQRFPPDCALETKPNRAPWWNFTGKKKGEMQLHCCSSNVQLIRRTQKAARSAPAVHGGMETCTCAIPLMCFFEKDKAEQKGPEATEVFLAPGFSIA